MPLNFVTLSAESLREGRALTACAQGLLRGGQATLHAAADGAWFLIGGERTRAVVWRVRTDAGALVADELWRDETIQGWSVSSTVDEEGDALFVTLERGEGREIEVTRIALDGDTRVDRLSFTCPSPARRHSTQMSVSGGAYLLTRVGSCAHLWQLG